MSDYVIIFRNLQNGSIGFVSDTDEFGDQIMATYGSYDEAEEAALHVPILRIADYVIVEAP